MGKYRVLDILSYVPKQKIDLEQLETIFVNEINNVNATTNGYYVEKCKQIHELEKNIKMETCVYLAQVEPENHSLPNYKY